MLLGMCGCCDVEPTPICNSGLGHMVSFSDDPECVKSPTCAIPDRNWQVVNVAGWTTPFAWNSYGYSSTTQFPVMAGALNSSALLYISNEQATYPKRVDVKFRIIECDMPASTDQLIWNFQASTYCRIDFTFLGDGSSNARYRIISSAGASDVNETVPRNLLYPGTPWEYQMAVVANSSSSFDAAIYRDGVRKHYLTGLTPLSGTAFEPRFCSSLKMEVTGRGGSGVYPLVDRVDVVINSDASL